MSSLLALRRVMATTRALRAPTAASRRSFVSNQQQPRKNNNKTTGAAASSPAPAGAQTTANSQQPVSRLVNQPGGSPPSSGPPHAPSGDSAFAKLASAFQNPATRWPLVIVSAFAVVGLVSSLIQRGKDEAPAEPPAQNDAHARVFQIVKEAAEDDEQGVDVDDDDDLVGVPTPAGEPTAEQARGKLEDTPLHVAPADAGAAAPQAGAEQATANGASTSAGGADSAAAGDAGGDAPEAAAANETVGATAATAGNDASPGAGAASGAGQVDVEEHVTVSNWAGTHSVEAAYVASPTTALALERLVQEAHAAGRKLRPVGNALSPNGIGFDAGGMVSLAHLDDVISVDPERREVTVRAGARVSQVLAALKPFGLTLQNFSSVQEQQMGGWTQARGCRGGCCCRCCCCFCCCCFVVAARLPELLAMTGAQSYDQHSTKGGGHGVEHVWDVVLWSIDCVVQALEETDAGSTRQ